MEDVAYMSNYFLSTIKQYLDNLFIYLDKLNASS